MNIGVKGRVVILLDPIAQCFSTFVRQRPGNFFFS